MFSPPNPSTHDGTALCHRDSASHPATPCIWNVSIPAAAQVRPGMTVAEYAGIDRGRIHALTGPILVEGAQPGDVLQVDVIKVAHKGWGWSSVVPGLGFLKQRFAELYLFHWQLDGDVSRSLAPRWCRCARFAA